MTRVVNPNVPRYSSKVLIQGTPAYSIIDSGADVMIMGGSLFRKVAAVARLKKRDFKKPRQNSANI